MKKGYEPTAVDKGYWGRKFENHPPVLQSVLWEQMNETERTYWGKVGFEGNNRKVLLFFCKYPHRIASKEPWEKLMKYLCSETKLNHPLFKLILKWSYKLGDVRGDNGKTFLDVKRWVPKKISHLAFDEYFCKKSNTSSEEFFCASDIRFYLFGKGILP